MATSASPRVSTCAYAHNRTSPYTDSRPSARTRPYTGNLNKIGDNYGALEYLDRLKEIDPRSQFVKDNYEKIKDRAENGSFGSFFKKIFGKRMGV